MSNLIPLEEAATMLGVSVEDLTSMRSRGDIHGYRDGKTWKFKASEIERYKAMNQTDVTDSVPTPGESAVLSNSSLEIDADLHELVNVDDAAAAETNEDKDVIDDDDIGVESSASSTIIGKPKLVDLSVGDSEDLIEIGEIEDPAAATGSGLDAGLEGSDLKLVGESGVALDADDAGASDLKLVSESGINLDDEITLDSDASDLKLGGSDIELSGGSDIVLDADMEGSGVTGELPSIQPDASSSGVSLEEPEIDLEEALNLSDEDLELSVGSSSEVSLEGSDLSLAASDTGISVGDGSDVTLDASGSGINLGDPADSGISLDQTPPGIELGGESLELGEADELVDFEADMIEDDLEAEDDFSLSPSASDLGEEDSGSQVIALDTEELDDGAATVLGDDDGEFETFDAPDDEAELSPVAAAVSAPAPFTIFNVLALGSIVTLLGLTGILVLDLVHNMWSWQGTYGINSTIMDAILSMFGA